MKQALIFDLDGTLWNAASGFKEAYDIEMNKTNRKITYTQKDFENMMGFSPTDIVTKIAKDNNWDINKAAIFFKDLYLKALIYLTKHPGTIYKDEELTLKALKDKYDLYIVSNSGKGYIELYLSSSKLGKYFSGFLQAGDTGLTKANNIKKLMKDKKINEAIYIGDTLKDYNATKEANIEFIYAAYGFGKVPDYKYKLDQITDLIILKDKLFI